MINFYRFVQNSSKLSDPAAAGIDAIMPILEDFKKCVKNLKLSVRAFEQFEKRFDDLNSETDKATNAEKTADG